MPNTNDGSTNPPALRLCMNLIALNDLPEWSAGPHGGLDEQLAAIAGAGFHGVQFAEGGDAKRCAARGLLMTGSGRVNTPDEADTVAAQLADLGHACATLHVGWGMEDDATVDALVDAVLTASDRRDIPLYIETHRATITQDIWRTVKLTERFPDVRFNADFSHWYTGLEMKYGGFENKLAFMQPVIDRVAYMHGRIGNPGCIQVDIGDGDGDGQPHVEHFRVMWTACFEAFVKRAAPGDYICFTPELLSPRIWYAREFPDAGGVPREEGDRWTQSLLYNRIAGECFEAAHQHS
ncbi:MAG: hypothetical protein GC159_22195 [Phycisphaera sp.]|nr:hypothetical protein [Phycisphaera sp.]